MRNCRISVLVLAAACCLVLGGCGGAKSRLDAHVRRGQEYFARGDYARAGVEFRNALQISPKDPVALVMAARTLEQTGKLPQAAGLYAAAIEVAPDNLEARTNLAHIMVLAGASDKALETLAPAIAKHPNDVRLLTYRATAESQLHNDAAALADIERALQLDPANEEAVAVRAGQYRDAGDLPAAEALIGGALKKAPNSTAMREILTNLYMTAKEPGKAEEQLRALIALKPEDARYREQLALLYAGNNRPDEAQKVLEESVRALPHSNQAKFQLTAFVVSRRGNAEGERLLQDYVAREPDNHDLRLMLGALQQRAGENSQAIATYQEVIRRDGTAAHGLMARNRIAAIDVAQARYADARTLIDQVLKENPRDTDSLTLRGAIALAVGNRTAAIADLRAVLRDQPQLIPVRRTLAQTYAENGQASLAEESYRTALELAPADPQLNVEMAQLLMKQRDPKQAVALLEKAVRDAPTEPALREELVRAYIASGDFATARTAAADLKTLRPDAAVGYYLAGLADQGAGQTDEARKELQRALAIQPQALDALTALARLELSQGRGDAAVTLVKNFGTRDPANANVPNLLAELYLAQKKPALAIAALNQAIELAPHWAEAYRNLAMVKYVSGDPGGAIAAYDAGIKADPDAAKLVIELATLYEKQGRVDEAIARYEDWYQKHPNAQQVANNLAMLLVTYKKDPRSLDRARELTSEFAASEDGGLLDTGGWVRFKRAEYAQALPILERAVERAPQSQEIHYHLGMAELQAGHTERARHELETALSGSATFTGSEEARSALASLKSASG
jgi:Flp pilus assembly protein TadD